MRLDNRFVRHGVSIYKYEDTVSASEFEHSATNESLSRQGSLAKPFTALQRYASAVYATALCLSVCLSQVGVLLKQLNVGSRKQHHTIAQVVYFSTPKISAKFDLGQPLQGRQMQMGWVKIGDCRQITRYISKTVQDRRTI